MTYRWESPREWLDHKLTTLDLASIDGVTQLWHITQSLVLMASDDQIQDEFQSDMESDGYFKQEESE